MNSTDPAASIREHAWRYFELHANQRMALFNYFLVASCAIAAGLAATLQSTQRFASLGVALGVLLVLVAFTFWKLDQRVSFLIKRAEALMAEIEQTFPSGISALFLNEPNHTLALSEQASWWGRHWTFGTAFRFVFVVMALGGASGAVLSLLRFLGRLPWQ